MDKSIFLTKSAYLHDQLPLAKEYGWWVDPSWEKNELVKVDPQTREIFSQKKGKVLRTYYFLWKTLTGQEMFKLGDWVKIKDSPRLSLWNHGQLCKGRCFKFYVTTGLVGQVKQGIPYPIDAENRFSLNLTICDIKRASLQDVYGELIIRSLETLKNKI